MTAPVSRRSGGRAARKASREAPLSDAERPIQPGMEGGTYKPLSPEQIDQIHEAALQALETIGLADAPESGVAYLTGAGGIQGDDGRIRFPRAVVEEALAKACKKITLCGRDPRHDMQLWGARVHYGTAGAAVHMVDVERPRIPRQHGAGPARRRADLRSARQYPLRAAPHGLPRYRR